MSRVSSCMRNQNLSGLTLVLSCFFRVWLLHSFSSDTFLHQTTVKIMPRTSHLILLALASQSLAYQWPAPQYDQLEQFLYEGSRADGSNIASIVHPCRKRTGTSSSIPAEWLRFVNCCTQMSSWTYMTLGLS